MYANKYAQQRLRKAIVYALSGAALTATSATWQVAKAADDASGGLLELEEIVITGVPVAMSKMKTSSSVSTLDESALELAAPVSAAEAMRSIPGIHSEASAGEGNTNMSVRGIPISAGGSRYIGFQEDGIPVLLNGDYAFVTGDMFLKVDNSLDHIEAVRGGAAGIMGYNSAGALINFISKDGSKEGGSVGLTAGLDYNQYRWDWDYGQHLSEKTRFFVGGFYREGEGIRNGGLPVEHGGQIKANITHEFGENGSFIRLSFKHLDDHSRLEMPGSYRLSHYDTPTKEHPATIQEAPGYDPRYASFISPYWPAIVGRDKNNNLTYHNAYDGLVTVETAIGVQFHLALGNDWNLDDSFRHSSKSGFFLTGIATGNGTAVAAGPNSTYANGPLAGQPYTGNVMKTEFFDTTFNDIGSMGNALKLSKKFDFGGASFTPIFGWDMYRQKFDLIFGQPAYQLADTDNSPALIVTPGVTDATGQYAYADSWGFGAERNVNYRMSSPYFNFAVEGGALNIDGGVRYDSEKVTGTTQGGVPAPGASLTNNLPALVSPATNVINYKVKHPEFSLGGNYQFTDSFSSFLRYSSSASFNVIERIPSSVRLDGRDPVKTNTVKQFDLGAKLHFGGLSVFATVFDVKVAESNVEVTTGNQTFFDYDTKGMELEASYHTDVGFDLQGSLTLLNPKIVNDHAAPSAVSTNGNQPNRMSKIQYQLNPTYTIGAFKLGLSIYSQGKSFANNANSLILPGFTTIGIFSSYNITEAASVSLSVNNAANTIGWTEMTGGPGGPEARSINGRSIKAGIKYKF